MRLGIALPEGVNGGDLLGSVLVDGNIGGIDVGFLVKTAIVSGTTPRVTVNAVSALALSVSVPPSSMATVIVVAVRAVIRALRPLLADVE